MSTAWKGSIVLLREPPGAFLPRLGYRALIAGLCAFAAVFSPWTALSVLAWVAAAVAGLLAVLAVANILLNRRVLLRYTGAGSIEWPQSIQERVLRRPLEWVAAREVVVTNPPVAAMPGPAEPRVSLSDGTRSIERVPLYGASPEDFVEQTNRALEGRGVTLRFETGD